MLQSRLLGRFCPICTVIISDGQYLIVEYSRFCRVIVCAVSTVNFQLYLRVGFVDMTPFTDSLRRVLDVKTTKNESLHNNTDWALSNRRVALELQ